MRTTLETTIQDVLSPFHPIIDVAYSSSAKEYSNPVQEKNSRATKRMLLMGRFYEGVTQGFFGGELNDTRFERPNGKGKIKPDVIDWFRKLAWEVKGSYCKGRLDIGTEQLLGYQDLQYKNPDFEYYYSFFRHSLKSIKNKELPEKAVVQRLSKSTEFSIVLPLSVVVKLTDLANENLFSHYSNDESSYDNCYMIGNDFVNKLFSDPEKVLDLIRLNPEDYKIRRVRSPEKFRVNRFKLNQFPILHISDRNHSDWVEGFKEKYEEEKLERVAIQEDSEIKPVTTVDDLPF